MTMVRIFTGMDETGKKPLFVHRHHVTLPGFGVRHYDTGPSKSGLHITAKTHRAVKCTMSVGENPDHHVERLQMLKDRRDRRIARRG